MKTWEMIKELMEHPEKKFKSISDRYGDRVAFVNGFECIVQEDKYGNAIPSIVIHREWEEVKEPVTWQEAFKAGLEGKKIKPKGQYLTFPDYEDLLYTFKYLTERPGYFKKVMLDDWYIED